MYIGFIAKRYATALADFAAINNEEERVFDEVKRFITIFDKNRYARSILLSPVQPIAEKENAVQKGNKKSRHTNAYRLPANRIDSSPAVVASHSCNRL